MSPRTAGKAALMSADAAPPPIPRPPANIPTTSRIGAVTTAIRHAAQSTGASFEHLLATAKVESSLNPDLTTPSSSATGLFQFLEQTWLGLMKEGGRAMGFGRYADSITQTTSGRYVVGDPALRREIMALRKDPTANALMGGVFTQQNAAVMAARLGRTPTEGELYIGHFFGPYAGTKALELAVSRPNAIAADLFPAAAQANRPIFYDKQGKARTIAGVCDELARRYHAARAPASPIVSSAMPSSTRPALLPAPSNGQIQAASPTTAQSAALAYSATSDRMSPPRASVEDGNQIGTVFHTLFQSLERQDAGASSASALWTAHGRTPDAGNPPTTDK
jgi:hypothetical protein